jgi:hypothetical protein
MLKDFITTSSNIVFTSGNLFKGYISKRSLPSILLKVPVDCESYLDNTFTNRKNNDVSYKVTADNIPCIYGVNSGNLEFENGFKRPIINFLDTEFVIQKNRKILKEIVTATVDENTIVLHNANCRKCLMSTVDSIQNSEEEYFVNDFSNDKAFIKGKFVDFSSFVIVHPRKEDLKCIRDVMQMVCIYLNMNKKVIRDYNLIIKGNCQDCLINLNYYRQKFLSKEFEEESLNFPSMKLKDIKKIYEWKKFPKLDVDMFLEQKVLLFGEQEVEDLDKLGIYFMGKNTFKLNIFRCDLPEADIRSILFVKLGLMEYSQINLLCDNSPTLAFPNLDLNKNPVQTLNELKSVNKITFSFIESMEDGKFSFTYVFENIHFKGIATSKRESRNNAASSFLNHLKTLQT